MSSGVTEYPVAEGGRHLWWDLKISPGQRFLCGWSGENVPHTVTGLQMSHSRDGIPATGADPGLDKWCGLAGGLSLWPQQGTGRSCAN